MPNISPINLPIRQHDDEPRVLDTDLGAALDMAQPLDIRRTIEANREELERYGTIFAHRPKNGGRGRPATEYHLNEAQALLMCMFSRTSVAAMVREQVIRAFMEWRQGKAPTSPSAGHIARIVAAVTEKQVRGVDNKVGTLAEQVEALRTFVSDLAVTVDRTRAATDFVRALDVAVQEGVKPKGRGGLVRSISARLRTYSATVGYPMRRSAETKTWLFHVDAVNAWLRAEGNALVRSHKAQQAGQTELRLVGSRAA